MAASLKSCSKSSPVTVLGAAWIQLDTLFLRIEIMSLSLVKLILSKVDPVTSDFSYLKIDGRYMSRAQ